MSALFEIEPFVALGNNLGSVHSDLNPEVVDNRLWVLTASGFLLANDKFLVSFCDLNFSFRDGGLYFSVEIRNDLTPDFLHVLLHFFLIFLAAFSAFVASFEELSIFFLHLCHGCLPNHISVLFDEWLRLVIVKFRNSSLNIVKIFYLVAFVGHGLAHVSISGGDFTCFLDFHGSVSSLNCGDSTDHSGGDKSKSSHFFLSFIYLRIIHYFN
jgi:hypothetical protein